MVPILTGPTESPLHPFCRSSIQAFQRGSRSANLRGSTTLRRNPEGTLHMLKELEILPAHEGGRGNVDKVNSDRFVLLSL